MDSASSTTCPPTVDTSVPTMGRMPASPAASRKRGIPWSPSRSVSAREAIPILAAASTSSSGLAAPKPKENPLLTCRWTKPSRDSPFNPLPLRGTTPRRSPAPGRRPSRRRGGGSRGSCLSPASRPTTPGPPASGRGPRCRGASCGTVSGLKPTRSAHARGGSPTRPAPIGRVRPVLPSLLSPRPARARGHAAGGQGPPASTHGWGTAAPQNPRAARDSGVSPRRSPPSLSSLHGAPEPGDEKPAPPDIIRGAGVLASSNPRKPVLVGRRPASEARGGGAPAFAVLPLRYHKLLFAVYGKIV